MATYLELVRAVARESGTVRDADLPGTLAGLTGRLAKMAEWTARAWVSIQNGRGDWLFMQGGFEDETVAGQQAYSGADLGATRFARFMPEAGVTLYRTVDGPAGEGRLIHLSQSAFRAAFDRGEARTRQGQPSHFTTDPQGRLVLWPTPDDAFTLRGLYRKDVQRLTVDADEPDMPARFHDLVMWRALVMLAANDESLNQLPYWRGEEVRLMADLERDELPAVTLAGALA